ncbi:MAG: DUF1592 domain-containing protein [Bradymonadia bacterium]
MKFFDALRQSSTPFLLMGTMVVAGCGQEGVSDDPVTGGMLGENAGAAGGAGGVAGGGEDPLEPIMPTCDAGNMDPGPALIRRLTRQEYNNSVRDLFGFDSMSIADEFLPEEEMLGFNNQAASLQVSPVHVEEYMNASEAIARRAVSERYLDLVGVAPADLTGEALDAFILDFGMKVWRRPLEMAEQVALRGLADQAEGLMPDQVWGEAAVEVVLRAMLQSPNFLFRIEVGEPMAERPGVAALNAYEIATRLSYLIWQSTPDDALLEAAGSGRLVTPEEIQAQTRRMLEDDRARSAMMDFFDQWLRVGHLEEVDPDPNYVENFDPEIVPLFEQETHRFLEALVWGEGTHDLRQLFTAPFTFVNATLAEHYGLDHLIEEGAVGEEFTRVALDGETRRGVLTQASVLSVTSKPNMTNPIERGLYVRSQILCHVLPSPPADLAVVAPEPDLSRPTREIFAQHSNDNACIGCHSLIDPVGFAFEHYDPVGRWRDFEREFPVDASGALTATDDANGEFYGVVEMSDLLGESEQVQRCISTQVFRFAFGRGETAADDCTLDDAYDHYAESGYDFLALVEHLTMSEAFRYRRLDGFPTEGGQ